MATTLQRRSIGLEAGEHREGGDETHGNSRMTVLRGLVRSRSPTGTRRQHGKEAVGLKGSCRLINPPKKEKETNFRDELTRAGAGYGKNNPQGAVYGSRGWQLSVSVGEQARTHRHQSGEGEGDREGRKVHRQGLFLF